MPQPLRRPEPVQKSHTLAEADAVYRDLARDVEDASRECDASLERTRCLQRQFDDAG
jgi:hypothetical protein